MDYVNVDITTVESGVILHGVNCQRAMNSGVARSIRNKWPVVYDEFMTNSGGVQMLGHAQLVLVAPGLWVMNCFTQLYYGRDGRRYADVNAIDTALNHSFRFMGYNGVTAHLPKIGCGLGGLSWEDEVLPIIEMYASTYDVPTTIYTI